MSPVSTDRILEQPFFSVIIPTYNRSAFLLKAIHSVICQSFTEWELIIVDDGSTDDTKQAVEGIADSRLSYVYQQNAERSAARNNGIRNARGKYVCFLDSDDQYLADHLSSLHDFLKTRDFPVAMIFTDYVLEETAHGRSNAYHVNFQGDPVAFFLRNPIIPSCVCVHADVLQKIRFDEKIKVVEDTVLWIKIALAFPVFHIDRATVHYFLHGDNSVNLRNNAFKYRLDGLRKLFNELDRKTLPVSLRNEIISGCFYGIAKHYYLTRQFFPMVLALFKSFITQPLHSHNKAKIYMVKSYLAGPQIDHF